MFILLGLRSPVFFERDLSDAIISGGSSTVSLTVNEFFFCPDALT